jgi:hypothetical protein
MAERLVEGYTKNGVNIERTSRMLALAEERRNRALTLLSREKERHGAREAEIIDAEFTDIER